MQPLNLPCSSSTSKLPVPFFGIAFVLLLSCASLASSCTEQEKSALIEFRDGLSLEGNGGLNVSWVNSTDCCQWEGITCGNDGMVTDVLLDSRGLAGMIPPSLSHLTGLLNLNLSCNSLHGKLPAELVFSSSIVYLDVSYNHLSGPLQVQQFPNPGLPLKVLNISSNNFIGQLPSTALQAMNNLVALNASNNSFTGPMPSSICNHAPSLAVLDICHNEFSGTISPEFGNCSMLTVLRAGYNNLTGTLPQELFKATSLEHLSFPNNNLQGVLDGSSLVKLSNLVFLDLGSNGLRGEMPDSIGQLGRLEELHLDNNLISGELPSALGNCRSLRYITLRNNSFKGELSRVNFTQLLDLGTADFSLNQFNGTIPESIYDCSNLIALRLAYNNFSGQFSPRIANLRSLSFLSVTNNSFTDIKGALQKLNNCKNLTSLLIGTNFKGETIPHDEATDGFQKLRVLTIDACPLVGTIPLWLSKLTKLEILDLSYNNLTGQIPSWINGLQLLFFLDISSNKLTGDIPTELMQMPMLQSEKNSDKLDPKFLELPVFWTQSRQYRLLNAFPNVLNLCNNRITGIIPQEIGQLKVLNVLNFSSNNLSGEIPQQICNLTNLQTLDLSNNQLTGKLPSALSNLHFLSWFNVSNNELEGPVPSGGQFNTFTNSSYSGNPKLCGPMLSVHCGSAEAPSASVRRGHKKTIFALALGVFFGGLAGLLLLGRLVLSIRSKKSAGRNKDSNNREIEATSFNSVSEHLCDMIKGSVLVMVPRGKGESNNLTFSDILKATNNFDQQNIIGCGGNGLVYRAELPCGSKLAIKKLNGEMFLMEREFTAEVEALSMAQHENLVPLWGYCIQGSSRLLIYSFMENGSLDDWLHNKDDGNSFLDWPTRLKIARGAGRGLSYIHNTCKPHIIHRDVKSSNILLDREFNAYVADFGLARLILPYNTHVTTELVGTLGYIPPEYGQAWVATLRGDIYSFGVVLLELLTRKRPVQVLTKSKQLVQWVREMRSQGKDIEVLDPALRGRGYDDQMLNVLEVACKCINHNPCLRPTIQEVVYCLDSVDADLQVQI